MDIATVEMLEHEQSRLKSEKDRNARLKSKELVNQYLIERTEAKQQELRAEFQELYQDFIEQSIFKREEVFHCWVAESAQLGNPYPMIRGARIKHISA